MESCIIRICRNTIWCKKVAYILIILDGAAFIVWSGFMETRSVFLLTILFGGYDTSALYPLSVHEHYGTVHYYSPVMVLLVPRALLSMIRGH